MEVVVLAAPPVVQVGEAVCRAEVGGGDGGDAPEVGRVQAAEVVLALRAGQQTGLRAMTTRNG